MRRQVKFETDNFWIIFIIMAVFVAIVTYFFFSHARSLGMIAKESVSSVSVFLALFFLLMARGRRMIRFGIKRIQLIKDIKKYWV